MSSHPLQAFGIIPARYESTRFPGKPLVDILGKPMFWHVYQRASRCVDLDAVYLATDDDRIYSAAQKLKVPAIMTRSDHASGTDRVLEAAQILELPHEAIVVNIQGDEPTLDPATITTALKPFADPSVEVTTLAHPLDPAEAQNPNRVTVVISKSGKGLYFSRTALPYVAGITPTIYGHIGLYAYRMGALKRFVALGPSRLEQAEKLEMLRLLENDIDIYVELTESEAIGVDHPDDLEKVIALIKTESV